MRYFLFLIIPVLVSVGCNGSKKRKLESEKGLKVRFEIKNFQMKLGDCDKADGECAQVDMVYPIVEAGVPLVKQAINDSIYNFLIQCLLFEGFQGQLSENNLDAAAHSFLNEWQEANLAEPDNASNSGWEVSVTGEVGLHTPKVVSITMGAYSYAGGAHPNSFVSVLNFDLKTGKSLTWSGFITDQVAFEKMVEKEFRKARDLPKNASLTEEGFFWGEKFELPANFELQQDGIYFWYNPFEVAAYALGPTDFTISYDDLGKLVNKDRIF
ncbi:MAG: DUF3298 and DUF4163 domain-containing protein [Saprospiraceae bacterium]|nr:DUF3298 and DUF4163 domain-containing protein [Saprospiraceae bacterium]MCF8249684.1 DUF3298 and DUF4163 domain-containing protein [Saprospiraceae bacterium]MCF8279843.1 DUF3298 and DUF4163 domain-containing protein [Bacteroidales bacterium]MCF8312329.1 DUF3298 and DUF4163 domain-containing protein [Saprospiraceae bacterium]MCF8440674.1 DUF3298 and DUF4163 domain-containing protein [Saprospiraceae bacterium]